MVGIVAVLVLVTLSLIVTRVGASALEATGVSRDLAHFQARSAFTGVGYTTDEAESVARHPVRRRIVLTLMLLGNAGIVSVVASLVLGFSDAGGRDALLRLGVLVVGLLVLGIRRANGEYLGAPSPETVIGAGDTVVLYGREADLDELDDRPHGPTGDAEHDEGVIRQDRVRAAEEARDRSAEVERQARDRGEGSGERRAGAP